jgi:translation initiation factor IF-2
MSDNETKPTLGRKPLGLKLSVESGEVKQTFSHGRTNKVVVEVKRRKILSKPGEAAAEPLVIAAPEPVVVVAAPPPPPPPVRPAVSNETRQEMQARLLREAEESRMLANEETSRREQEARLRAAEEEKRKAEDVSAKSEVKPVVVEAAAPVAVVDEPVAAPVEVKSEADAPDDTDEDTIARSTAPRRFTPVAPVKRPEPPKKPAHPRDKNATNDRRQSGKLTVSKALNEDEGGRVRWRR